MNIIKRYKDCMLSIFEEKYGVNKSIARQWIEESNFDYVVKLTHDFAMHYDPEDWVDVIYKRNRGK